MTRLILILLFHVAASASDLQQPPAASPGNMPRLSPLLARDDGKSISTKRDWQKKRAAIERRWMAFMGDFPKRRPPLNTEFLDLEDLGAFTRQYVRYQVEDGVVSDGYLLMPKSAKNKLPAIVVFHPTTPLQAKGVAGVSREYPHEKQQGVHLVERGYIVFCPRNFIFDEHPTLSGAKLYTANVERMRDRHPDWTGMARMTFDAIRAADFVESLPNVDPKRIGCIGHSLGAKVALYAGAFDERYKAVVSSEGGIGLTFSNWDAVWYLGPQIRQPEFRFEHHEVLALAAPRAFLLLAGESADGDRSWAFISAAQPVYQLLGARERLGWFNHRQGHAYPPSARDVAESFLDSHLKK